MAKKILNWKEQPDGTYTITYDDYTGENVSKKEAVAKGIVILDSKSSTIQSSSPVSNKKQQAAFYNNWKNDSVPGSSSMSSSTQDPYAGFKAGQSAAGKGTVDPIAVEIYNMTTAERKELATLLKNAGFKVSTSGKYSDAIVNSYLAAREAAASQSARLGREFTVREYLLQETPSEEGKAATQPSVREDIQIWNPTKIAGVVQDLVVKLLQREATPEEVAYLANKLTAAQKKAATKTQYVTKGGKVTATVTGGLDEEQFLIDLIQKDKKFAPEITAIKEKKATAEASATELTRQDLIRSALANGITLNADQIANFEQRIKSGEKLDAIKNTIRETASLGMPDSVKKLVASGVDLSTVYSPYKSILAQTLEINPNSINLDDPTLRMAIGPDKEMSLYEYQKVLRKDPRWQYTNQARTEAANIATTVLRDFGFMG